MEGMGMTTTYKLDSTVFIIKRIKERVLRLEYQSTTAVNK